MLTALTLDPVRIDDAGEGIGSHEAAKEAHLEVWSVDPLEFAAFVDAATLCGGPMPTVDWSPKLCGRYRTRSKAGTPTPPGRLM